jgi:hypothetical protein
MIRHHAGSDYLLITQNDHALLSGQLAREIGNDRFAAPDPFEPTVAGITLHDCGWPLHDDVPTLNKRHVPLHVFETPPLLAVRVWAASVDLACQQDPYAGLLVSLHVLRLSDIAVRNAADPAQRARLPQELFALNKFQHREIERQAELRPRLGLRTDVPLHLGLAGAGAGEADDRLRFNAKLLQMMDMVSLALCCSELPFPKIDAVPVRPAGGLVTVQFSRQEDRTLVVDPWLFKPEEMTFEVPYRSVPAREYADDAEFRSAYAAANSGVLRVRCRRAIP